MKNYKYEEFKKLAATFNQNLSSIKRQLNSQEISKLYSLYNPEDDEHLAKIISLKGIKLY